MGNSTIKLADMFDIVAGRGIPDPRQGAAGYGNKVALDAANDAMADLICERFNWKFNSQIAAPFYTNGWQQDYPQLAQAAGPISWGDDCDCIDINNTALPKLLRSVKWRRALPRTSLSRWITENICWMYNKDLTIGVWPGANVTYQPLIGNGPTAVNPWLNMLDVNGNILIVTTFGTTGTTAPSLPAASDEGTTVTDGSVIWTCVSPTSQGFRIDNLPGGTSPVWKIVPSYQLDPPRFLNMQQTLDPIPDSFSRHYRRILEAECLIASANPGDMKRGELSKQTMLEALEKAIKQGDRELNIWSLMPASGVVEERYGNYGKRTAADPY